MTTITPTGVGAQWGWQAAANAWARRGCPYDAAIAQLGGDITALHSALDTFCKLGARAATPTPDEP
jgi:hypothetical protein